jgi:hypothetical protein
MSQESAGDAFRAIVEAQWGVMSSGATDAPTGRFSVVEIPEHDGERAEMCDAVFDGDNEVFENMDTGWYFVIQYSSNRLTYDKCKNRDYAFARFSLARSAYDVWLDG